MGKKNYKLLWVSRNNKRTNRKRKCTSYEKLHSTL